MRVALALGIGAGFTYLLWLNIGTHLTVTTDIVGRTTFADFDIYRYLERFYDIAFVLPASSAIAYVLLHFFGPLRATPPARPWPPLLEVVDPVDDVEVGVTSLTDTDDALTSRQLFWTVVRVGLVALVVGIESNIARSPHETVVTTFAFAIAALYVVAVGLGALGLGRSRRAASPKRFDADVQSGHHRFSPAVARDVSVVNAFASVVVIPLLVLVSSSTTVTVARNGRVTHYPWFPAWLGATVTVVVLLLLIRAMRHAGHDVARRQGLERRALLMVVVPIFLFVVTGSLQPAQRQFLAFDDAQGMVGAKLSFWHGLWPWRDVFLLHGFFADALTAPWACGSSRRPDGGRTRV